MAEGGHDDNAYEEAGEEFRPGREGMESDALEERREELRRREERERKEEEERKEKERQGARSKTKKVDGKTYTAVEGGMELDELVVEVKIDKDKSVPANVGLAAKKRVTDSLDGIYKEVQHQKIKVAIDELSGNFMISSLNKNSNFHVINDDGNFADGKEHKKLRDALGVRLSKSASNLDAQEKQVRQRQTTTTPGGREAGQGTQRQTTPGNHEPGQRAGDQGEGQEGDQGAEEEQREIAAQLERIEAEREGIIERMSLREKVKYYFKKYGFTVVGILTAIGAVIGSILSNLKTGLAKVAKGVGNGLKDLEQTGRNPS